MNKLNNEELAQVSGSVGYGIFSLDAGDVFIDNANPKVGIVIKQSYTSLNQNSRINVLGIILNGDRIYTGVSNQYPVSIIQNEFTYSPTLSGTVPYN